MSENHAGSSSPPPVAALEAELARERRERARVEAALQAQIGALEAALAAALDASSDRAHKIFQNAADAILLVDVEGKYTYVTPSIERVTGYSVEETVGTEAADWLHPEDLEGHVAKLKALKDGSWHGAPRLTQYRRKHKTRGWVWVEAMGANLIDDPAVRAVVVTMRDMTERRRVQEELQSAKEAAEAASLTKSAFLANMSHELRTPLNGVIGMVDLLARSALDDRQRRYTEVARSSADLLLAVINDILDFSKIEAGRLELESVSFQLEELLEEVASVLALAAEQKGLELICQTGRGLRTPVRGDPARIRQVLLNLVNNAVKFTARGEVVLSAAVCEETAAEIVVRIDVRDTGIGIPHEARTRLFRPFSQVDASTTRTHGGTGLGLAICHQLVIRMGGSLAFESEAGRGSTFSVTLPLVRAPGAAVGDGVEESAPRAGGRVLLVDDNACTREVLEQQLGDAGMRCDSVREGAAALVLLRAAAAADPYALAIVDVDMPGMDGLELARLIKADARLSAIEVLLLGSLGSLGRSPDLDQQRALGIAGYLSKPVRRGQLLRVISAALQPPGERRASAPPGAAPRPAAPVTPAGLRALVVEDSEINAEVAGEMLRSAGIEVDVAVNGALAVAAILNRAYDVVLMDCQLPVMDGFEATRRIRAHETAGGLPGRPGGRAATRLPILALTASATAGDFDQCLQAGMDGYVTKPVDAHRLFEAIERVAGPRAQPRPGSPKPP